jgi:hypothetical protein
MSFIRRITAWNKARYEQKYDHDLSSELLQEELIEFFEAKNDVDKLDALVDMIYIAVGAMWKMGLSASQIKQAIDIVCDSNDTKSATKTPPHIKANIDKGPDFIRPEPRLEELLKCLKKI